VFFSFHYDADIFRANQVRNANVVVGTDVAGFFDHSEYESAKKVGPDAIRRMILRHLDNTSVTVVLIGNQTASRPWVQFEIAESVKRKNGFLGIYINHLVDHAGRASYPGPLPAVPFGVSFPAYSWDADVRKLAQAIEEAGKRSDSLKSPLRGLGLGGLGGFRLP